MSVLCLRSVTGLGKPEESGRAGCRVPRSWTLFVHERDLWSGENDGESGHPHPAHDDGTVMNGAPLVFWVMIGPPAGLKCPG